MAEDAHGSDRALLARIARGDREAFAALYRRRRPDVYRFALHMSGSHTVAEDVAHDVFMAVIDEAARYVSTRAAVVPWLLGIARNHVKRRAQRDRRIVSIDDESAARAATLTMDADPASGLEQAREVAAVRRALMALPAKYREAIVLCDLRELSYAEAAIVLKCAIGTVRSRLHRGRALLARRLRGGEPTTFAAPATKLVI